jgi:hypothetical protein
MFVFEAKKGWNALLICAFLSFLYKLDCVKRVMQPVYAILKSNSWYSLLVLLRRKEQKNNERPCNIGWVNITCYVFYREVRSIYVYGSRAVFSYPIQFNNQYTCSHVSRTDKVRSLHIRWSCDIKVPCIREYHSEMSTVRRTVLLIHTDSSRSELHSMCHETLACHVLPLSEYWNRCKFSWCVLFEPRHWWSCPGLTLYARTWEQSGVSGVCYGCAECWSAGGFHRTIWVVTRGTMLSGVWPCDGAEVTEHKSERQSANYFAI